MADIEIGDNNEVFNDADTVKKMPLEEFSSTYEDLKSTLHKIQKTYKVYKLSNCFSPEVIKFCTEFHSCLQKTECAVHEMGAILEKFSINNSAEQNAPSKELTPYFPDKLSLTPPHSETGSEDAPPPAPHLEIGNGDVPLSPHLEVGSENAESISSVECKKRKQSYDNNESSKRKSQRCKKKEKLIEEPVTKPEEVEYEIDHIKDLIKKNNSYCFLVSWQGYGPEDDTYEPMDNIMDCELLVITFLSNRLKKIFTAQTADELKSFHIPLDSKIRDLLYESLLNAFQPIDDAMIKEALKISLTKEPMKSIEEQKDALIKLLSFKDPTQDKYKKLKNSIINQLSYDKIHHEREKQLACLRAWEKNVNFISRDPVPITVENNVDLQLPPEDFTFINDYLASSNIVIPDDPRIGCECNECISSNKGCCPQQMDSHFAYNKHGRLRVSLGTPIFECNKLCACSSDCPNRVVQKMRRISLCIFKTDNGRGWGVKAQEYIKKGAFITEYIGEVITSEEAERRGMEYDAQGCTYLFDLDYNKGDQNPYTVDAAKFGNVSHFINHSCDPNLVVFNVWINCLDPDLPKLALFSTRDIKKGEELTFDYNSGSTRSNPYSTLFDDLSNDSENTKVLSPSKLNKEQFKPTKIYTPKNRSGKTECFCGAANCRKYFF